MSAWRRKALTLFPDLRPRLQRRDYSVYTLYFDLLPMCFEAHDRADTELLRRIYGFAAWCSKQRAQDPWNAAAVSFYEHLFDTRRQWRDVLPWLTPQQIQEYWPLWRLRLSDREIEELRQLVADYPSRHVEFPE